MKCENCNKWRIWDKINKCYMPNPGLLMLTLDGKRLYAITGQCLEIDDYILERFTNWLDKNGEEIYEGSKVSFVVRERKAVGIVRYGMYRSDLRGYGNKDTLGYYIDEGGELTTPLVWFGIQDTLEVIS